MIAGAEADDIHIVHRRDRFPIPGTKAEKRVERAVAADFLVSALAGIGFIVAFIALPFHWHLPGNTAELPLLHPGARGPARRSCCCSWASGMVLWAKWLMPEEEAVQDRHDDPSTEEEKLLTEATLLSGLEDTGLPRRSLILKTLGLAGGAIATVPLVALVGAMIKKPGDKLFHTLYEPNKKLFRRPNGPRADRDSTSERVGPDDDRARRHLLTVFPGVHQEGPRASTGHRRVVADPADPAAARARRSRPARVRPASAGRPTTPSTSRSPRSARTPAARRRCTSSRPRVCCARATSRSSRSCEDAKPVFGPASRSLPKLPLGVEVDENGRQYFYARSSDYHEADRPRVLGATMTVAARPPGRIRVGCL